MSEDLRELLAYRRREALAQGARCLELEDGTLICVGEFGWFEVPPQQDGPLLTSQ